MTRNPYSRYTELTYEPDDREQVVEFWEQLAGPAASVQPGFRGAFVVDSDETAGLLRAITLWRRREDFEAFFSAPDHDAVGEGIRASSMQVVQRDGLSLISETLPATGLIRFMPARVVGDLEGLRGFWRSTGKPQSEEFPGCVKAEAFADAAASEVLFFFHWRSLDDANAFLESDVHRDVIAPGLAKYVTRLDRRELTPL